METIKAQAAHMARVKFHGPSNMRGARFTVAWEDYPSRGGVVRKGLPFDYGRHSDNGNVAADAARMVADWLTAGQPATENHGGLIFTPEEVRYSCLPGTSDEWVVLIRMECRETA